MAVPELHKPNRRACAHVTEEGCSIHDRRPEDCRLFHCLWLRGAITGDEATRPDALGVMFDQFTVREDQSTHTLAFELWSGALDSPAARAVIDELAHTFKIALSYRDGRWSEIAPPKHHG
jgi:Fe-S-cluster containining protein